MAKEVRLLDETGKQIGIFTKDEALAKARTLEIDVVEIASNALPPVCKLIDFKKFKYQESKKERELRKKAKTVDLKQLRLRPFIGDHDFEVRVAKAREFLKDGNRIKIMVQFFGREIARKEFGFKIIDKFQKSVEGFAQRDREPKFEGKTLVVYFTPVKGKKHAKDEDEKSGSQTL